MGGQAEAVANRLKERYRDGLPLAEALEAALFALTEPGGERFPADQLEVAVLDRNRPHRKFLRLNGPRLERLLAAGSAEAEASAETPAEPPAPAPEKGDTPPTAPEGDIDTGSDS